MGEVAGSRQRLGGGLQKNSCQQCGSQSGSGGKAWAGGAVFPPASGLCCFSCGASHSHNPFRLWTVTCQSHGLDLTLPPSIARPCQLHSSANPRQHDPPRPRARMSMTEGKRDLAITQMATLLIQGKSPLCRLPIFTSSFQGLNTTFGSEEIKV